MPRWIHPVYIFIWGITAVVFASLTYSSYSSTSTTLARLSVPEHGADINMGGLSISDAISSLAAINNKNVDTLEESIRSSAWLSFWLNFVSCLMALLGGYAQFVQYRHEQSRTP